MSAVSQAGGAIGTTFKSVDEAVNDDGWSTSMGTGFEGSVADADWSISMLESFVVTVDPGC